VCVYVYVDTCMCVFVSEYTCMSVSTFVSERLCVCVCVCVGSARSVHHIVGIDVTTIQPTTCIATHTPPTL